MSSRRNGAYIQAGSHENHRSHTCRSSPGGNGFSFKKLILPTSSLTTLYYSWVALFLCFCLSFAMTTIALDSQQVDIKALLSNASFIAILATIIALFIVTILYLIRSSHVNDNHAYARADNSSPAGFMGKHVRSRSNSDVEKGIRKDSVTFEDSPNGFKTFHLPSAVKDREVHENPFSPVRSEMVALTYRTSEMSMSEYGVPQTISRSSIRSMSESPLLSSSMSLTSAILSPLMGPRNSFSSMPAHEPAYSRPSHDGSSIAYSRPSHDGASIAYSRPSHDGASIAYGTTPNVEVVYTDNTDPYGSISQNQIYPTEDTYESQQHDQDPIESPHTLAKRRASRKGKQRESMSLENQVESAAGPSEPAPQTFVEDEYSNLLESYNESTSQPHYNSSPMAAHKSHPPVSGALDSALLQQLQDTGSRSRRSVDSLTYNRSGSVGDSSSAVGSSELTGSDVTLRPSAYYTQAVEPVPSLPTQYEKDAQIIDKQTSPISSKRPTSVNRSRALPPVPVPRAPQSTGMLDHSTLSAANSSQFQAPQLSIIPPSSVGPVASEEPAPASEMDTLTPELARHIRETYSKGITRPARTSSLSSNESPRATHHSSLPLTRIAKTSYDDLSTPIANGPAYRGHQASKSDPDLLSSILSPPKSPSGDPAYLSRLASGNIFSLEASGFTDVVVGGEGSKWKRSLDNGGALDFAGDSQTEDNDHLHPKCRSLSSVDGPLELARTGSQNSRASADAEAEMTAEELVMGSSSANVARMKRRTNRRPRVVDFVREKHGSIDSTTVIGEYNPHDSIDSVFVPQYGTDGTTSGSDGTDLDNYDTYKQQIRPLANPGYIGRSAPTPEVTKKSKRKLSKSIRIASLASNDFELEGFAAQAKAAESSAWDSDSSDDAMKSLKAGLKRGLSRKSKG